MNPVFPDASEIPSRKGKRASEGCRLQRLKVWGEQTEQTNCWWRQRQEGGRGESPHLKYRWQSPSLFLSTRPSAWCPLWWTTIVLFDQERHKEGKRERREEPAWELSIPRGWGLFTSRDEMKLQRRTARFLDCVLPFCRFLFSFFFLKIQNSQVFF